ncbi:hypothetical protein E2C01_010647 [Portunus trituberculatus]|uniref:Uncharacterized protein n=1 Tax=Portunus trituberculatus TaxID=210409 RepID=A0A5B7D908_PORTR|nr:hypothetical protein [Portunus trituberculatus]
MVKSGNPLWSLLSTSTSQPHQDNHPPLVTMPPKCKLRDEWLVKEEFIPWLTRVEGDPEKAFCTMCNRELSTLKRHKTRQYHITNEASRIQDQEGGIRVRQEIVPPGDSSNEVLLA